MPYSLSFSEEFFVGPEENYYDLKPLPTERPKTVLQALVSMSDEEWDEMCEDVFPGATPDLADVMAKIRETDTCSSISSPIDVWIDEEGYFTITVYEDRNEGSY